jgi:ribosome-binding factor A
MNRLNQLNKRIQKIFGLILQREADLSPDVLVTVSHVDTTPNLASTKIWLYINPDQRAEEILQLLKEQLYDLQGALNKALDRKVNPRISLMIDHGITYAEKINKALEQIESDDS